jgi:hypothetical protein
MSPPRFDPEHLLPNTSQQRYRYTNLFENHTRIVTQIRLHYFSDLSIADLLLVLEMQYIQKANTINAALRLSKCKNTFLEL